MPRKSSQELSKQAKANGYRYGAHYSADSKSGKPKYVAKTLKDHGIVFRRYEEWVAHSNDDTPLLGGITGDTSTDDTYTVGAHSLRPGLLPLDPASTMDFLRYYASTGDGQLEKPVTTNPLEETLEKESQARMTTKSLKAQTERFFALFEQLTGNTVPKEDKTRIYYWIKTTLTEEGVVVNIQKEKHLFGMKELIEFNKTFWTADEGHFIHPRNKAQVPFLMSVYCWTGARIGSFFPDKHGKLAAGLRYRDIELVLIRDPSCSWKVAYSLSQRWVKNNRDPENIVYKASTSQHETLLHDDTQYLLAMALADGALYGIQSAADLWDMSIPDGETVLRLRWKDEVLQLPILRNATKWHGLSDTKPLAQSSFEGILKSVLNLSGYYGTATVHAIRRALGKKVNEVYTEVERSQHINHTDTRVYGQSYVANTSSVDGRRAFTGEKAQHDHIEYFQGFEPLREKGLPNKLSAEKMAAFRKDPQLLKLEEKIRLLQVENDVDSVKNARKEATNYRNRLKRKAIEQYQQEWIRQRRDWKIDTRGKICPDDDIKTDLESILCRLFPERGRIAKMMTSNEKATEQERKQSIEDLCSLISRDCNVLHLPGEEPINGLCPVKGCGKDVTRLPKRQWSTHIHACRCREITDAVDREPYEVTYCYDCFEWVFEENWEKHCSRHLESMNSKRCAAVWYCSLMLRPIFCPFCLGNNSLPAASRRKSWTREDKARIHLEAHLEEVRWPFRCPHPLCDLQIDDERSYLYHLSDAHGLQTRQLQMKRDPKQNSIQKPSSPKRGRQDIDEQETTKRRKVSLSEDDLTEIRAHSSSPLAECSIIGDLDQLLLRSSPSTSSPNTAIASLESMGSSDEQSKPTAAQNISIPSSKTDAYGSTSQPSEEGAIFSQFLRSRSPSRSGNDNDGDSGNNTAMNASTVTPQDLCLTLEDRPCMVTPLERPIVELKKPRLWLSQPKLPKVKLRLSAKAPRRSLKQKI